MVLRLLTFGFVCCCFTACGSGESGPVSDDEQEEVSVNAETLYTLHCEACHGADGTKGTSNAANLATSKLGDKAIIDVILNGNDKGMMPYREILGSEKAAQSLAEYVKTLRK